MLKKCRRCQTMVEIPFTCAALDVVCKKCSKKQAEKTSLPPPTRPSKVTLTEDERIVVEFLKQEEGLGSQSLVIEHLACGTRGFVRLQTTLNEARKEGVIKLGRSPIQMIRKLVDKGVLERVHKRLASATYTWGPVKYE